MVGSSKKQYSVHAAAFSRLSDPLEVMLNGPHKESQTMRVEWPDVDERTFVRFTQWAYTKSYDTEEPDFILDQSSIELLSPTNDQCEKNEESKDIKAFEQPIYSLQSWKQTATVNEACSNCALQFETCRCGSTFHGSFSCCNSRPPKKSLLVAKFLDKDNTDYPTTASVFEPRRNKECCEDYSGVFMCHAKLYVLGDVYDIPQLRQLSLHRLHATLREFTLYPSRLNDIAVLTRYIFDNTQSHDKIREMIILYYTCIIEDVLKQDGLRSLIDDIPEFAYILITKMSERLA